MERPVRADGQTRRANPVYSAVYADIEQRIRRGEWLPGGKLPSISSLARELRVGAGSVREALRALATMGLVRIEHGSGVFVADRLAIGDLPAHFQIRDIGLLLALAETRRIIEPELAALAAERGSEQELHEIETLARQMEQRARQGVDFVVPDVQFHRSVARAAHNPVLLRMMESMNDLFVEMRTLTSQEPGMTARAVSYHLLIAEALRGRNSSQARLLMLAHMNDSLSSLLATEAKINEEG
jgi:GntR family transcriptional repressor for pyruvate dehydrogenase complex